MRKQPRQSALVVGLGRFGSAAGERLVALGWDVVGVDLNPDVVQSMRDRLTHVVELDASDEEALATVDVPRFDICIVSRATSVESSILLNLNLQHLGARKIVAKAATEHHARILGRLGVSQVVFPERDAGIHLADSLQSPHLVEWIDLPADIELAAIRVPEDRVGTALKHWKELRRPGVDVLARLDPQGHRLPLDMNGPLGRGETIVVIGTFQDILTLGR